MSQAQAHEGIGAALFGTGRPARGGGGLAAAFGLQPLVSARDRGALLALIAFAVLVFLGPAISLSEAGHQGSSARQIGYFAILAVAIWAADPLRRGWRVLALPAPVVVALGWCWLSIAWAISPDDAVRRVLLTSVTVWTTFILVAAAGTRQTLAGLRVALVLALIANLATVYFAPQVGTHTAMPGGQEVELVGDWRGFMTHKNFAGALCGLTVLLFVFDADAVDRRLRWAVLAVATLFLIKSGSKTSAGMTIPAGLIALAYARLGGRRRALVVPLAMVACALLLMIYDIYADDIGSSVLNPQAFTGRGMIWAMLVRYAGDHPWLGAGFGSFWNIGDASPVYQYGKGYVTQVTIGHSGYLDLLVSIGLPGLLLVSGALLVWPMARLLSADGARRGTGTLACAVIAFAMGHNVTESSMFERDAIVGVFLLFAVAFAGEMATARRQSRRANPGDEVMRTLRRRKRRA